MTTLMTNYNESIVLESIVWNEACFGHIRGLDAEKILKRFNQPYLYLLRAGEKSSVENLTNFYVSFVLPDLSIKHQPFTIITTDEGWFYENGGGGGPFVNKTIEHVLHKIMHCEEYECTPLGMVE